MKSKVDSVFECGEVYLMKLLHMIVTFTLPYSNYCFRPDDD